MTAQYGPVARTLMRYGFAVLAIGAALLVRLALTHILGPGLPTYITFYPAVMLAALLWGEGPAVAATALAVLVAISWLPPPAGPAQIASPADVPGLLVFLCLGSGMSVVAARYHRARTRAAAAAAEAAHAIHAQQFDAVREASMELTRELDLTRLLQLIVQRAVDMGKATSGALHLWDAHARRLIFHTSAGARAALHARDFALGEGVVGTVAQRRTGLIVNDYRTSPDATLDLSAISTHPAVLGESLLYHKELIGVVTLDRREADPPFAEADGEILRLLANQAAIAIVNARFHQAAIRRGQELDALLKANQAIESSLDLATRLHEIVRQAAALTGATAVRIFVVDESAQMLRCPMSVGPAGAVLEPPPPKPLGQSFSGDVLAAGRPVNVPDMRGDARLYPEEEAARYGLVSYLGLPINRQNGPSSVLTINTGELKQYTESEIEYLSGFARQAGIALDQAELFTREQQRRTQLEAIHAVSTEVTRELDLTTLLTLIVRRASDLVGASTGIVHLWDPAAEALIPQAWAGLGDWGAHLRLRLGEGVAGLAAQRRTGLIVNDFRTWPAAPSATLAQSRVTAVLAEPLLYRDRLLGTIALGYEDAGRRFSEADRELLGLFAAQAAIAIENARLFEAAQRELGERNRAEAQLRAALQQFHDIIEFLPDPTFVINYEGKVLAWNRAMEQLTGTKAEAVVGQGEYAYALPLYRERRPILIDLLGLSVAEIEARYTYVQRLGDKIYAEVYVPDLNNGAGAHLWGVASPLYDAEGRKIGAVEVIRDITEHKRAADALAARTRQLTTLTEMTRALTTELDLGLVSQRILNAAQTLIPGSVAVLWECEGDDGTLRVIGSAGLREPEREQGRLLPPGEGLIGIAASTRQPVISPQVTQDPRFLSQTWAEDEGLVACIVLPLLYGERISGYLSSYTRDSHEFTAEEVDLLRSFAAQAAIAIENARLFQEQQRAYAQLQATQEELVRTEKLRALGQMAAGVAHDLNNMLAAILGQAELLRLRVHLPEIQEALQVLYTAASDGAQVVRRLQEFSRQQTSATLEPCDLAAIVREALELTRPRWQDEAQRQGRTITVCTPLEGLPRILGHPAEVREALTNLILNAVDAMPHGGTLTLAAAPDPAPPGTQAPASVFLTVTDTGTGMPEEVRRHVFDPFYTTKGLQGTGLGLAVVYGILERHGGRIDVASTLGEGTTFTLRFQAAASDARLAPAASPPPTPSPRRILLIDDEAPVRTTLATLLREVGHEVVEAENGATGLARLAAHPVDLVITDLGMPEMTGWQVAERVKIEHPQLPVILLTGWGQQISNMAPGRACVDRVLAKPVRLKDLQATIAECLKAGPAPSP